MHVQQTLVIAVLAAIVGGLIAPALAQPPDTPQDPGTSMDTRHRMGRGMTGQGMMAGGMMQSGCAGMMQSMNGGDGRPNSQWPAHRPDAGAMVN